MEDCGKKKDLTEGVGGNVNLSSKQNAFEVRGTEFLEDFIYDSFALAGFFYENGKSSVQILCACLTLVKYQKYFKNSFDAIVL